MESRQFFHISRGIEACLDFLVLLLETPYCALKVQTDPRKSTLLAATLQTLSMAVDLSTESDVLPIEYRENVVKLFSLAGHVDKLGELFRIYESNSDNGKWAKQTSEIVLEGLRFMRVVAGSLVEPSQGLVSSKVSSVAGASFGDSCISGLVSVLFSMTDGRGTWAGEVAIITIDVLNTIARLDLQMFQTSLNSSSLQPQFYHVLNFLLDKGIAADDKSTDFADVLIRKTLVLMGYHGVTNKTNQESLNWGTQPTALQKICSLPFRFFNTDENKKFIFPTLIAVCYDNKRNTSVVEQELSADLLVDYMNLYRTETSSKSEDNKENEKTKAQEQGGKVDSSATKELENIVESLEWGASGAVPKSIMVRCGRFLRSD